MGQPQGPASPGGPIPSTGPLGLTRNAKIIIIVGVVAVVAAGIGGAAYYVELQPKIVVTNTDAYYSQSYGCSYGGSRYTTWHWSATLVNTGGGGFADIGYVVSDPVTGKDLQASSNTYFVPAHSQLSIEASQDIDGCYASTPSTPSYDIVVVSQRAG